MTLTETEQIIAPKKKTTPELTGETKIDGPGVNQHKINATKGLKKKVQT